MNGPYGMAMPSLMGRSMQNSNPYPYSYAPFGQQPGMLHTNINRTPGLEGQVIDRGTAPQFDPQQLAMLPNWQAYLNYGRR